MDAVVGIVLPVFGLVAIGYGASWSGRFSEQANDGLTRYVFVFAIPVLLFRTLATTDLPDVLPLGFLGCYYLGLFAVFAAGMIVARVFFAQDLAGQTISGTAAGYSNAVLLGIPIVLAAFGEAGAVPLFLVIAIHGPLMFPIITILLEVAKRREANLWQLPWLVLKGLITNPIFVGLLAGLAFNLANLPIWAPVDRVAELLSGSVAPCALFAVGASLYRYRIFGNFTHCLMLTALKTLVFPAVVWLLAFHVFRVDPLWGVVAVVLAAQPAGVNAFLFANRYGVGEGRASSTVLISTAFSVLTLSLILQWLAIG